MPETLARKISLSFISFIFAEGHIIMRIALLCRYCSIVRSSGAAYGHIKPVRFGDFTRLKRILSYICRCMCCHT